MAVAALCILAPASPAHSTWWYWTAYLAEGEMLDRYSAIEWVDCNGFGKSMRTRSGAKGYKHFDCYVEFNDGEADSGELHVTGKSRFRFRWD